jgi:hypothetical protein
VVRPEEYAILTEERATGIDTAGLRLHRFVLNSSGDMAGLPRKLTDILNTALTPHVGLNVAKQQVRIGNDVACQPVVFHSKDVETYRRC